MKRFKDQYLANCRDQQIEPLGSIIGLPEDDECVPSLNLGELTLGTKNGIAIGQALHNNQTFTHITLSESYMGDSGVDAICQGLMQSKVIESIDFRGSNLYKSNSLAQLVSKTYSLKELKCEWNSLGTYESGITELSEALKVNKSITTLDLRNNKITPEGAHALANALRVNTSLKNLDLRWNYLGVRGGKYILEALNENYTIIDLKLAGNEIDYKTLQEVEKLVRRNYDAMVIREKEQDMSHKLKTEISELSHMQNVSV